MLKEYLQIYKLSIVIIGKFNPVIIQPYWLAHKKFIREQEAQDANVQLIHRDIVKYSVDWADIEVLKDRMELSTTQEGVFDSLKDLAISILQSLKKNNKLPEVEMLQMYRNHTDKLFITSPFINLKPKKRHPNIEKLLNQLNDKVKEVKFSEGIIRSRIKIDDANAIWNVNTFLSAFEVNA